MLRPTILRHGLACAVLLTACGFGAAVAAQGLGSVSLSPDVSVELDEAGGGTFADEDVAIDDLAGSVVAENLGTLPAEAEVAGYELLANGDRLFCLATTTELPGSLYAQQGDVVRLAGSTYSIEFDASANGVPPAAQCDALSLDELGRLWLSFDISVALPDGHGGTITADDEDAVRVDGPSAFTLFDATTRGVPGELDLDGLHLLIGGDLAGSFDTSGQLGNAVFDDEDVVGFEDATQAWSTIVDASSRDADWGPADADAVALPEPGAGLLVPAGLALLLGIGRRRTRR